MLGFMKDLFSIQTVQFAPSFSAFCALLFLFVWTWTVIHFMDGKTDIQILRRRKKGE